MSLDGSWIPENEAEKRLMEDIHVSTRRAYKDGAEPGRIAALLAFLASATLDPASEQSRQRADSEPLHERMSERKKEPEDCPECGTEIGDVLAAMGGMLHVGPCGCQIEWEERDKLGDWADEIDPEVEDP